MVVVVETNNGLRHNVIVRWSDKIKSLYTVEKVMLVGNCPPSEAVRASAPFAVYKGMWTFSGWEPEGDFFDESNKVCDVRYEDGSWNYR